MVMNYFLDLMLENMIVTFVFHIGIKPLTPLLRPSVDMFLIGSNERDTLPHVQQLIV